MNQICLFVFIILITFTDTYDVTSPILWQNSKQPVIRTIDRGFYESYYSNPCVFYELLNKNNSISEFERNMNTKLFATCNEDYERGFWALSRYSII